MRLKPQHWAIAISLSAAAHLVFFVSGKSAQMTSSERSKGTPAAVWGMAALMIIVLIFRLFFTLIMPMYTDPMGAF